MKHVSFTPSAEFELFWRCVYIWDACDHQVVQRELAISQQDVAARIQLLRVKHRLEQPADPDGRPKKQPEREEGGGSQRTLGRYALTTCAPSAERVASSITAKIVTQAPATSLMSPRPSPS
jgi:hypothetical protein